jgi:mannose-1-phosphate guanylyltransferase
VSVVSRLPPPIRNTWAVVLAAGEGSRLSSLTTDASGHAVPKQFCSLDGGATFLQDTLRRAHAICGRERIAAIVADQHARWWRGALWALPATNVVVQPRNRGTANGVLLSALTVAARDPLARIVFLPSDHFVRDEERFERALREAANVRLRPGELVLLGIEPEEPDPELGYLVPSGPSRPGELPRVRRFVEKPTAAVAADLIADGALWNSFVFAGDVSTLVALVRSRFPDVVDDLETALARGPEAVEALYERLPSIDFSRHVLEGSEARLRVVRVAPCGWSDLGTPRRVAECLARLDRAASRARPERSTRALHDAVNLAAACARLQFAG